MASVTCSLFISFQTALQIDVVGATVHWEQMATEFVNANRVGERRTTTNVSEEICKLGWGKENDDEGKLGNMQTGLGKGE